MVVGHDRGRSTHSESARVEGSGTGRDGIARDVAGAVFRYRESLFASGSAAPMDGCRNQSQVAAVLARAPGTTEGQKWVYEMGLPFFVYRRRIVAGDACAKVTSSS